MKAAPSLPALPPRTGAETLIEFTWEHLVRALSSELLTSHLAATPATSAASSLPFSILTDTRLLQPQQHSGRSVSQQPNQTNPLNPTRPLFMALDGAHFRGIDFITQAYHLGVRHFIFDSKYLKTTIVPEAQAPTPTHQPLSVQTWLANHNVSYLAVTQTLTALGRLAQYKLHFLDGIKIGITGSAGKTSTKNFLKHLLQTTYHLYSSPKNFNNTIGLPLSVLAITEPHDFYLFEMGMNAPGEISWLSEIVQPDCSILTNILPAHIGNLGSLRDVAMAKCEIFNFQRPHFTSASTPSPSEPQSSIRMKARKALRGKVFYPSTTEEASLIKTRALDHAVEPITYDEHAFSVTATLSPSWQLGSTLTQLSTSESYPLATCSPFSPPLAALGKTILQTLSLPPNLLKTALKTDSGSSRRLEIKETRPKIIDDAYNANPTSMENVIRFFAPLADHATVNNLIFILGDMLELGDKKKDFHQHLAHILNTTFTTKHIIFCYGKSMLHTYSLLHHKQKYHFLTPAALIQNLRSYLNPQNILIFKGSNGMQLGKVIEQLLQKLPPSPHF